jgi:hypothetical protein
LQSIVESAPKKRGNPYRDANGRLTSKANAVYDIRANPNHVDLLTKLKNGENEIRSDESRASRTSKVERRIVKKQTICERCRLNEDPNNVPVHPHCDCDVVTDSLESGVADPESRFFSQLSPANIAMEIIAGEGGVELPAAVQLNSDTVAILDGETARFADLARWMEQMQPYLDQGAQYLSIVVDDDTDEAVQQTAETIQSVAEGTTDLSEAIKSRKLWFALAKSVVF